MKKKKIFIYGVLICNRRKLDSSRLHQYFFMNNYQFVQNPKDADIILLSTCSYSTKHKQASLDMIKKFLNYDAELIVTGCLPEINKAELKKIFDGKTISTKELKKIDGLFPENKIRFTNIADANIPWENVNEYRSMITFKKIFGKSQLAGTIYNSVTSHILNNLYKEDSSFYHRQIIKYPTFKFLKERINPSFSFYRNTYFIRPSRGCLGNCSYCVIKKAIGPLKSKSLSTITTELKKGLSQGYKNFIFDADDLGAYGLDIGSNFPELLDKITITTGEYKIYIRYVHPRWIVKYADDLEKVLKKGKIQGIGCSIQSGSSRILKLMHRYSNVENIKNVFSKLLEIYPDLLISTECINGFPTETMEEFEETLNVINEINFHWGNIFPFSCKSGTDAERLEPKISDKEILDRMKYAQKYLKQFGYESSFFKHSNILAFSKTSTVINLGEGAKSFCLSTIE